MCSFPTGIFCLHHWGRIALPFITGEGIFFPFAPRKESSLLPRCGWGRNFLPFLLGKEFSSLLTGEGIFFPSLLGKEFSSLYYWWRNFLPSTTREGIFFPPPLGKEFSSLQHWGRNFLPSTPGEGIFFPSLLGKEFSSLHHWGRNFLPFITGEETSTTGEGSLSPSSVGYETIATVVQSKKEPSGDCFSGY